MGSDVTATGLPGDYRFTSEETQKVLDYLYSRRDPDSIKLVHELEQGSLGLAEKAVDEALEATLTNEARFLHQAREKRMELKAKQRKKQPRSNPQTS